MSSLQKSVSKFMLKYFMRLGRDLSSPASLFFSKDFNCQIEQYYLESCKKNFFLTKLGKIWYKLGQNLVLLGTILIGFLVQLWSNFDTFGTFFGQTLVQFWHNVGVVQRQILLHCHVGTYLVKF
jgi:hypothetical protein